jgi:hypothetical protein
VQKDFGTCQDTAVRYGASSVSGSDMMALSASSNSIWRAGGVPKSADEINGGRGDKDLLPIFGLGLQVENARFSQYTMSRRRSRHCPRLGRRPGGSDSVIRVPQDRGWLRE